MIVHTYGARAASISAARRPKDARNLLEVYPQIPWQRSANFHPGAARGMRKSDARRVQEVALEKRQVARARAQAARRAVERVAHDGMPDGRKVRADLVRAPGVQHGLDQRAAIQARDHAPVGPRVAALGCARGHARAAARIARNGQRDGAGIARHLSVHQRQINFPDVARAELFGEMFVRRVIPRHDHRARSFPVQAVHDARTQRAACRRKVFPGGAAARSPASRARGPRRRGPPSRRACSRSRNRRPPSNSSSGKSSGSATSAGRGRTSISMVSPAEIRCEALAMWPSTRTLPSRISS